ncbi:MAG: response regulator [Verrucomicrobia bacterium]|nr:response regulator [Verrucomicrobiota bacterium]
MPNPVILLAEDNELDAVLFTKVNERCGNLFQVVRVTDGLEAVDYLRGAGAYTDHTKFPVANLLLLDLKMPNKDGFEVLRWRQDHPAFLHIPVIVYSASYLPADVERAYGLGASSYVVKPTDPARLERFVRSLQTFWSEFNVTSGLD